MSRKRGRRRHKRAAYLRLSGGGARRRRRSGGGARNLTSLAKGAAPLVAIGGAAAILAQMVNGYLSHDIDSTGALVPKAPTMASGLIAMASGAAIAYLLKRPVPEIQAAAVGGFGVGIVGYLGSKITTQAAASTSPTVRRMVAGLSQSITLGDDEAYYLGYDYRPFFGDVGGAGAGRFAIGSPHDFAIGAVGLEYNY